MNLFRIMSNFLSSSTLIQWPGDSFQTMLSIKQLIILAERNYVMFG